MIARTVSAVLLFALGLGAGVLWSPIHRQTSIAADASNANFDNQVGDLTREFGEETAEFASQFKDLNIRIKRAPIDAAASPDGRFVIRLAGSDETIASDLLYPRGGNAPDALVRDYSFSCDGKTYSCAIERTLDGSKVEKIRFGVTDAKGGELSYIDTDADGRWDKMTDYTQQSPTFYRLDGLSWKELEPTE